MKLLDFGLAQRDVADRVRRRRWRQHSTRVRRGSATAPAPGGQPCRSRSDAIPVSHARSAAGATAKRDVSWLNASVQPHLSADGKLIVFTDQSESSTYSVTCRTIEDGPVMKLGEGTAVWLFTQRPVGAGTQGKSASLPLPLGPSRLVPSTTTLLER